MGLIGAPLALMDLANCEAFVQHTIDRSQIRYGPSEREELLAEGLTLLYELANKYKPLPEPPCGYAEWFAMSLDDRQVYERALHALRDGVKRGKFSGHAAMFLPRRLGDSWHKSHSEHHYVTDQVTGKRGWRYEKPMLSLDSLTAGGGDHGDYHGERHLLHARTISQFAHATLGLSRLSTSSPPVP
jgi:hypothetical protein